MNLIYYNLLLVGKWSVVFTESGVKKATYETLQSFKNCQICNQRGDVSSNLLESLLNAFMGLIKADVDLKNMIIAKSKIDRTGKYKTEKLICIGIDGKIDKENLQWGGGRLKTGKGQEQHLTIPQEIGTESREYLTHREIQLQV